MDLAAANKLKASQRFSTDDIERLEKFCYSIGRCHEIINKVEQLHSMKEITKGIQEVNNKISMHVEQS